MSMGECMGRNAIFLLHRNSFIPFVVLHTHIKFDSDKQTRAVRVVELVYMVALAMISP